MKWLFCFRNLLASASKSLRQGCCPLFCLFILCISMATNLPLCWIAERKITNAVCYNPFCHPSGTRAQIFCWLIICAVALPNLVLMPTTHSLVFTSFMAVIQVLGYQYSPPLQPLLYYLFPLLSCCDSYFIHSSPTICVTNLYVLANEPR